MGDVRIIVDHLKLEYSGVFNTKDMFKLIGTWFNDRFIQKRESKNFEQNLADGKYIEYEIQYWKKITDYHRFIYKLRLLMFGLKKVEIVENDKKISVDQGRALFYLDGYIEFDYEHRWEGAAFLQFWRSLMDKFIYRSWTEKFEQRWTHDCHQLYDQIQRFLNAHKAYRLVSEMPTFAY